MSRAPRAPKSPPPKQPIETTQSESDFLDQVSETWLKFGRFGWDVLGVGLLAAALLTLFGLFGLTRGVLLASWVAFLGLWLGWGAYLAPFMLAALGLLALRHHLNNPRPVRLGTVLALEGVVFALLALLTILGGTDLERARAGVDGGLIGWGLATLIQILLPAPWSTLLLALLLLVFLLSGTGFLRWAAHWIETQAEEAEEAAPELHAAAELEAQPVPEPVEAATASRGKKRAARVVDTAASSRDKRLPPLNLLYREQEIRPDQAQIEQTAELIRITLAEFGVPAAVRGYRIGPTVTQYLVEPGFIEKTGPDGEVTHQKVRVSQISALARDLALALSAERLRIEAPVPGQPFVGIEVPNSRSTVVRLRPILETDVFSSLHSPLSIALGQDVSGQPVVADLARMPHLLIAGTTGSGKSVCIAALTACLVVNNTPDDLRLAMLDPKMVELVRFNGLPHLLGKVETQIDRMLGVLRWTLAEMDNRYKLLENAHTRDISTYNRKMERRGQPTLPRIVLLVDELADLMMTAPDQTEHCLVRLAQMARATGIHLVVATQRPSTDVITGLIKANFPARISFTVASSVDSRVILDTNGAETLLGRGDMLFLNPEAGTPQRAQGVMVTDQEVEKVIGFWKKMSPAEESGPPPWEELIETGADEGSDSELVRQATELVRKTQRASASMLQRRLHIGYPRAARLMDELEEAGVVGPASAGGREREVLLPPNDGEEEDAEEDDAEG